MLSLTILLLILTLSVGQGAARSCVCGAPNRGGNANVRSCAATTCGALGIINPGVCYDHLGTQGSWHKIQFNGQTGYAHKDYLSAPHSCKTSSQQCVPRLCSSFSSNEKRECDDHGCGNYGASREGGKRKHDGWDIKCTKGATVYAPFDGVIMRKALPYKINPYKKRICRNTGFEIKGTGDYTGHVVKIFYVESNFTEFPVTVTRGQAVAKHIGMYCDNSLPGITDHIHYQLYLNKKLTDPASYIFC